MKTVFAHDHVFYKLKDCYFSNGGLSGEVLSRYTDIFGNITVVSRQKAVEIFSEKLTLINKNDVIFKEVPNFKSIRKYHNILNAKKIIKNEVLDSDLIIIRLPSSIGKITLNYAKKFKKRYLIELVGCPFDAMWNHGSIIGKIIAPFDYFYHRVNIKNSMYTIYVTKYFLQKRYPTEGNSINCSNVSLEYVEDIALKTRLEKIKNRCNSNQKIIIGMIGSLDSSYKGFETAIEAIGLLYRKNLDIELRILGKGNKSRWESYSIKNGVDKIVRFDGSFPAGKEVLNWLDKIDIYIQPSKTEGLPRATIEAMSRACPVIATNIGGIPELIDKEYLIKKNDSLNLADKIEMLIYDKDKCLDLAKNNFYKSKEYSSENLNSRRNYFFKMFKQEENEN